MAYSVLNRLSAFLFVAATFVSSCTDKETRRIVPKPGLELVPQIYVFFTPNETETGLSILEALPPPERLENELNSRVEFVPLDPAPAAAAATNNLLRDRFSRAVSLAVFKGSQAQAAFLKAQLPRSDQRKILFLGGRGWAAADKPDPGWFEAQLDEPAILEFVRSLCKAPEIGGCTSAPPAVLNASGPVQFRFGPAAVLSSTPAKHPYIELRIVWEQLLQALTDPKLGAYTDKQMRIGPSSPYFELDLDAKVGISSKLAKGFIAKRQELQLKALGGLPK